MVLSLDRWIGKVAIVTGASAGIGASIAVELASKGLIVAGIARRVEKVQELAKKITGKGKLHAIKADVTKENELLDAFKYVKDNLGPVHVLVNNAGAARLGFLSEGKTEDWKFILDLNVLALSIATREAVKVMRANNINGHIIHVNSVVGHTVLPMPGFGVYTASKFAVTALTETLRQELNHLKLKIKITSLSPGLVETEATTQSSNAEQKKRFEGAPILKAEDIADSVLYVLSTPEHVQVHELTIRPVG